ncbi:MAG: pyridoxamine 5'-phosphate oxidase [Acidimicrobiales bacterium]
MDSVDLAAMRREYASAPLDTDDLDADPMRAFASWFDAMLRAGADDANAMVVATADADGNPSARTVLLKGVDRGFVFFTSKTSRKATELRGNPAAALVFRWRALERQVTVTGSAEDVGDAEADAYFATRPRASQIGAWASQQSEVIADRAALLASADAAERRFAGREVSRPPFWGGFRVIPTTMEFWQGRPNRLHDRIRYRRDGVSEPWIVERLAP